jgi:hypothetical protein
MAGRSVVRREEKVEGPVMCRFRTWVPTARRLRARREDALEAAIVVLKMKYR